MTCPCTINLHKRAAGLQLSLNNNLLPVASSNSHKKDLHQRTCRSKMDSHVCCWFAVSYMHKSMSHSMEIMRALQ